MLAVKKSAEVQILMQHELQNSQAFSIKLQMC